MTTPLSRVYDRNLNIKKHYFHGYTIYANGFVRSGHTGRFMQPYKRNRRNGGFDYVIKLYILGERKLFTLSRLILECFDGPGYGYQANHLDRDPSNCALDNLEWETPKGNIKHWRDDERRKKFKTVSNQEAAPC